MSLGVERLAGMSLHSPVKVDMSGQANTKTTSASLTKVKKPSTAFPSSEGEVFAVPESLRHHVVVVPHKLKLVTLAAFLLMHCKVRTCNFQSDGIECPWDDLDFNTYTAKPVCWREWIS